MVAWGAAFGLLLSGCLTHRQEALLSQRPQNRVFEPGRSVAALAEGELFSFGEYDRGGAQSVCVLKLAPDAVLTKRYHARHDMTLFVVSGTAIVMVEETRYLVTPGSAVLLPRLTAYAIMPHDTEQELTALLIYSPPFDAEDTILED